MNENELPVLPESIRRLEDVFAGISNTVSGYTRAAIAPYLQRITELEEQIAILEHQAELDQAALRNSVGNCPSDGPAVDAEPLCDQVVYRSDGAFWLGMPVRGWRWELPAPDHPQNSTPNGQRIHFASHWSTGPKNAERLYSEEDIRSLLARYMPSDKPIYQVKRRGHGWEDASTERYISIGRVIDREKQSGVEQTTWQRRIVWLTGLQCDHVYHYFGDQPTRRCRKCGKPEQR